MMTWMFTKSQTGYLNEYWGLDSSGNCWLIGKTCAKEALKDVVHNGDPIHWVRLHNTPFPSRCLDLFLPAPDAPPQMTSMRTIPSTVSCFVMILPWMLRFAMGHVAFPPWLSVGLTPRVRRWK